MGGNPSITDQQKQELWNRDIERLFTTAKIIPAQIKACFIQSISTIGDKNESNLICLFCGDGIIRGILYSTKSTTISSSLIFTKVAESQNIFSSDENAPKQICFTSALKISEKYIVVTLNDGRFFLVSVCEKQTTEQNSDENKSIFFEFVLTPFSLPINQTSCDDHSPCIVKYTNDSFIAINSEMTAALCKSDGSTQIIWEGNQLQTNQSSMQDKKKNFFNDSQKQHFESCSLSCCATVYENYLFAVHFARDGNWKGLTYGIVKERINPLQSFDESFKTIIAMDAYESGIFCLCDAENENDKDERFSVISIDIDKNQIVKSPIITNFKELNPKDNFVVDFKVIYNKKILLCLTENSIITYSHDIEDHISQCQINNPVKINFAQLASFSTQLVFNIVVSNYQNQPNLYVLRITRKSKKTLLEIDSMPVKLNEGSIVGSCPVDDFTFATLEENGKIVLWQSQPEWWDVPYFQKIFDDQQQQ